MIGSLLLSRRDRLRRPTDSMLCTVMPEQGLLVVGGVWVVVLQIDKTHMAGCQDTCWHQTGHGCAAG